MNVTTTALFIDASRQGGRVIVSYYNEPLITSEWALTVFKEERAAGLVTGFVSNGNGTPQVLEYLRPWVDLYKVDLKSFDDRHYRQLGGRSGHQRSARGQACVSSTPGTCQAWSAPPTTPAPPPFANLPSTQ